MAIYVSIRDGMGEVTESGGTYSTTGATEADFMFPATDFIGAAGVHLTSDGDFEVTESSPAAKTVDIAAGTAYVENSSFTKNGSATKYWRVEMDAAETDLAISDNASGNPRIDIICIKIDTTATPDANASNVASIVVVEGTPAASPSVPSTPNNHYKLAEVAVANGFASIVDANITDKRAGVYLISEDSEVVNLSKSQTLTNKTIAQDGNTITSTEDFYAYMSAVQSVPRNTLTVLINDTESVDTGSNYNGTTGKYTVPSDGLYLFYVLIKFNSMTAGDDVRVHISANSDSSYISRDATTAGQSGTVVRNLTVIRRLSAGTTIYPTVFHGNAATRDVGSAASYDTHFMGYKVAD